VSYLDEAWGPSGETSPTPAGTWVPETRWEDWKQRGLGLPLRAAWTNVSGLTDQYLRRFDALDEGTQLRYFALLGRDMASVQRDGLIYFNAIERKHSGLRT